MHHRATTTARLLAISLSASFAVAASAPACLDATQISLVLTSDEGVCSSSTRYFVRVVDDVEGLRAPTGEVNAGVPFPSCATMNGTTELGDLTVVPRASADREKALVVELSLARDGRDPTTCADPASEGDVRCFVLRRRVRFVPHRALSLRMHFDERCAGKACDPASTCYRGGCVDSAVECLEADCLIEAERRNGFGREPPLSDGGARDATSADGSVDAAEPVDGGRDASRDGSTGIDGGCATGASTTGVSASRNKCALVGAGVTKCCIGELGFPTAVPAAGCGGEDVERWCTTNCDCFPGAECIDVMSSASGAPLGTRAACVQRGCSEKTWGREGAAGSRCESPACCDPALGLACKMGACATP